MNVLAMTLVAWGFSWVTLSFVLAGAWCAAIEIARWQQRRRRRRKFAKGRHVPIGPYNRKRLP